MGLIFKIAWRNVLRHKGKSLIIGVILFIGSLLMTFGNGVISGMDRGLAKNIVNGFLGDIVIISNKEKSDNILFKLYGESVQPISNFKDIKNLLKGEKYINGILPVGKNIAIVLNEEEGDPGFTYVLGVDFEEYRKFFPGNFKPVEGKSMKKNEAGILIPKFTREEIYNQMSVWLVPDIKKPSKENYTDDMKQNLKYAKIKDTAVFMGMGDGNSTSDIRLPVRGIIRFNALNTIWGHFSLMDIESYRQCLGYFSATDSSADVSRDKKKILSLENQDLDAMFGETNLIVADSGSSDRSKINFRKSAQKKKDNVDLEAGVYNLVFLKLNKGISLEDGLERLNKTLASSKLDVRAVSWKKASGFIGNMATIIRWALFIFVMLLFLVAIIIIVNTLSMAALERTTEIGMMRAIGARKGFISFMFIGETLILSGFFGGLGILVGIAAVQIVPMLNISSSNDLVQLLFGGDTFMPYLSIGDLVIVLLELAAVTLITIIYPVKVAKGITPLDAIARD